MKRIPLALGLVVLVQAGAARADFHADTTVKYRDASGNMTWGTQFQSTVFGTGANFAADVLMAVVNIGTVIADIWTGGAVNKLSTAWDYTKLAFKGAGWAKNCYAATGGENVNWHEAAHCLAKFDTSGVADDLATLWDAEQAIEQAWADLGDHNEAEAYQINLPAPPNLPDVVELTFSAYYTRDRDLLGLWSPVGWIKAVRPGQGPGDRATHPAIQVEGPGYGTPSVHSAAGTTWTEGYEDGWVTVRLRPRGLPFGKYPIFFTAKEGACRTCNSIKHTIVLQFDRNPCAEQGKKMLPNGTCDPQVCHGRLDPYTNTCLACPPGTGEDLSDPRRGSCKACPAGQAPNSAGQCVSCGPGFESSVGQVACLPITCDPVAASQPIGPGIPLWQYSNAAHTCQCVRGPSGGALWKCGTCPAAQHMVATSGGLQCQDCPAGQVGAPYVGEIVDASPPTRCIPDPVRHAPAGSVNPGSSCPFTITGWAWDLDNPGGATQVDVYDGSGRFDNGGHPRAPVRTLNAYGRPGTPQSPRHGFEYRLAPEQRRNAQTLQFWAKDPLYPSWTRQIGTYTLGCTSRELPFGKVESVTGDGRIIGYAIDPTRAANDTITVNVYVDNRLIASPPANGVNERVFASTLYPGNHGFALQLPASYRDGRAHLLSVQAVSFADRALTAWVVQGRSFTLSPPMPQHDPTQWTIATPREQVGSIGVVGVQSAVLGGRGTLDLFSVPPTAATTIVRRTEGPWKPKTWAQRASGQSAYVSQPVAVSDGTTQHVFVLAGQGEILHYSAAATATGATAPESLGLHTTREAPAVALHPTSGRIDVFVRGMDDQLWQNTLPAGGRWSGWSKISLPKGPMTSGPAALWSTATKIDVFYRSTGNVPWHYSRASRFTPSFESIGGVLKSAPSVAKWATGGYSVFGIGNDNAVWRRDFTTSWGSWASLGGLTGNPSASPAVASASAGRVDVFIKGLDGAVWQRAWVSGRAADEIAQSEDAAADDAVAGGCAAGGNGASGAASLLLLCLLACRRRR